VALPRPLGRPQSEAVRQMFRLATSPIAPLLGQRLPVRAPAWLLNRSYRRMQSRPSQSERVLTTSSGDLFQANLGSFQEWHLWVYGSFDDYVARVFAYLVRPGDRCVDAGASIGLHTVRLAKLAGPRGEVIAVEPDPEIARRAAENIALNGLANARVIQAAASAAAGETVSLYRAAGLGPNRAMASLYSHGHLTGPATQVQTITIDEACPGPVALMKIDVAGHEAAVVAGAAETIERYSPAIVFGYAPELLADPAQCPFGRLAGAGYLMYRISHGRSRITGRCTLRLRPLYAQPETGGDLLAVSEADAPRIMPLVARRDDYA
jgi:FkbM family methyltransferase